MKYLVALAMALMLAACSANAPAEPATPAEPLPETVFAYTEASDDGNAVYLHGSAVDHSMCPNDANGPMYRSELKNGSETVMSGCWTVAIMGDGVTVYVLWDNIPDPTLFDGEAFLFNDAYVPGPEE